MTFLKRFNTGALIGLMVVVAILALLAVLPNALAQSKAVLKSYPCSVDRLEDTAEQIRTAFKHVSELRVSADLQQGKIYVIAPTEVQNQIAAGMSQLAVQEAPTKQAPAASHAPARSIGSTAVSPASLADASSLTAINIPLKNITAADFEAKLGEILKNRLTALPNQMSGTNRYRLASAHQTGVELAIDLTANQVHLRGPSQGVVGASRLVRAMDSLPKSATDNVRMIAFQTTKPENMQKAVDAVRFAETDRARSAPKVANLFTAQVVAEEEAKTDDAAVAQTAPPARPNAPPGQEGQPRPDQANQEESTGLSGSVQVEMLEGLDVIVIRGKKKDIEQVASIIEQIEKLSTQTEPEIQIYPLVHANGEALAALVRQLYDEIYYARQGTVSITPLIKPNALLLVGRKENVQTAIELAKKLDTPVAPDAEFRVFPLKHATATSVRDTVDNFYNARTSAGAGLSPRVFATADVRSNAVIVQASPRDMAEIAALVSRLDTTKASVVNEVRIVKLEHTMADQVVQVLQYAFNVKGFIPQPTQTGFLGGLQQQQQAVAVPDQRSAILRFMTLDPQNKRWLESGILNDVRITADMRANAIVVSAPAESMELLVTLIHELDRQPLAEAQIKVFTIVNGDASSLMQTLQMLFTSATQQRTTGGGQFGGQFGGQGQQSVVFEGGEALIPVRLSVDTRTNSIIASGDASNLAIIEAILLRLDGSDVRNRMNHVYKLKNSSAYYVSEAINQFLANVRQMQQQTPGTISAFAQIEQEVIVVPETISNSLIVSATPRYFNDIKKIVEELDARPPMVMIQVLIAEVTLNDNEEFGVELGLQDGLLFDRSAAITSAATGATNVPGFNFNNQALGNNPVLPPGNAGLVGTQGLSNFSLNRTNSNLGYGGFVFSASSESVSVLIRALKENNRLEVLSRPQITTLDNQLANVFSGQDVPIISNVNTTSFGQTNDVEQIPVGLELQVTPRVSPDNLVVMQIDAAKANINPGPGVPISAVNGQVITQPIIDRTSAQTTVSAMDGQTVVLGGLITKSKQEFHRKVPWLGDVPYLGRLFRYDGVNNQRRELLIIMTPHVIRNEGDAEAIKKVEAGRMNWCLADVVQLTGDNSLRQRNGEWSDKETAVVYPDLDPRASNRPLPEVPEAVPSPEGQPNVAPDAVPPPPPPGLPSNGQPMLQLKPPSGDNNLPPMPPEPALTPAANGTSMNPIRPMAPEANGAAPAAQSVNYHITAAPAAVQPANYEQPATAVPDPRNQQTPAPVYYDAPLNNSTTQTTVYR